MKKRLYVLYFLISFVFVVSLFPKNAHALSNSSYIQITKENTPIMDNRKGSSQPLVQVGSIKKGQVFEATSFGSKWWKIKFGNSFGYVYYTGAKKVSTSTYKNQNKGISNSNTMVKTTKKIDVYDNTPGKLVAFATISANMRYPIIGSYGPNWWKVDVGGRIGYIYKPAVSIDKGIPVLMYHHLLTTEENKNFIGASTTITPDSFDKQMNLLKQLGYETITPSDLEQYLSKSINLPAKSVVITFDDGIKSTYLYAYPILKKYQFKATNFMITNRITSYDQPFNADAIQTLSTNEMKIMSDVFSFEGHTHNLHYMTDNKGAILSKTYEEALDDLSVNRSSLKEFSNAYYLAYPFGHYNTTTIEAAKAAGYHMAFTTKKGFVQVGDSPYELKRFNVGPTMNLIQFQRTVEMGF